MRHGDIKLSEQPVVRQSCAVLPCSHNDACAIYDVGALRPKLALVYALALSKSQKHLRGPDDSASTKDKVEFMGDFNILL